MDWLRENWLWIVLVALFFWMHVKMHGGHGGHPQGRHGGCHGHGAGGGCCGESERGVTETGTLGEVERAER